MNPSRIRLVILAVLAVIVVGFFAQRALLDSAAASAARHSPDLAPHRALVTPERGRVELRKAGTDVWVRIEAETEIVQGDAVRTGPGAAAAFNLFEQGMARLDENASATLEGLAWNEAERSFTGRIFVEGGRLWSRLLDFMAPESSFEVRTSHLVATVRGTAFYVHAAGEADDVYVAEHLVSVASATGTAAIDVAKGKRLRLDAPAARLRRAAAPAWKVEDAKDAAEDPWVKNNLEKDAAFMERVEARLHGDVERLAPRFDMSVRIEAKELALLRAEGADRQRVATRGLSRIAAEALLAADRGDARSAAVLLDRAGRFCVRIKDAGAECRVHPRIVEYAAHQRSFKPAVIRIMSDVSPDLADVMRRILERRAKFEEAPAAPSGASDGPEADTAATLEAIGLPQPAASPTPPAPAVPKPVRLELAAARYTFSLGQSGTFSAYLRWSDGRSEDVTLRTAWTLAPSAGYPLAGQMEGNAFVAGNAEGESKLTATYRHDLGVFTASDVVRVVRAEPSIE